MVGDCPCDFSFSLILIKYEKIKYKYFPSFVLLSGTFIIYDSNNV